MTLAEVIHEAVFIGYLSRDQYPICFIVDVYSVFTIEKRVRPAPARVQGPARGLLDIVEQFAQGELPQGVTVERSVPVFNAS